MDLSMVGVVPSSSAHSIVQVVTPVHCTVNSVVTVTVPVVCGAILCLITLNSCAVILSFYLCIVLLLTFVSRLDVIQY